MYIMQRIEEEWWGDSIDEFIVHLKEYINLQSILREANISTEIYPGESKLKKQMEYANKIKSPAVILYGENEIKSGKLTLKNLSSGDEKSIEMKELPNEIKKIIWSNN